MNTKTYVEKHQNRFINELIDLLKIPSISADSSYKVSMQEAAQMLANQLESAGCDEVRIFPTNGHAVVFGQKIIDAQLPTVLVYGHYDVQPPDPLDLWDSPPFDPVIKKTDIQKKSY